MRVPSSGVCLSLFLTLYAVTSVVVAKMGDHDHEKPAPPDDQQKDDDKPQRADKTNEPKATPDSAKLYQKLFKHKRAEQNEAVKTILGMPDAKKRSKLVDQLINTIHKVIGDSKVIVEGSGFTPGDSLPTEKAVRDGISQVLENAAFFAELALRFPKQVTQLYSSNRELSELIKWAVGFSYATGFYDSTTTELMHLAGQELGLVAREENYVNPYRQDAQSKQEAARSAAEQMKIAQKQAMMKEHEKKKQMKKAKKGPRMSGRNEL